MGCGASSNGHNVKHASGGPANANKAASAEPTDLGLPKMQMAPEIKLKLKQDAHPSSSAIVPDGRLGHMLSKIPLFFKLTDIERDLVGGGMVEGYYEPGAAIFLQNDVADKLYVITKGRAIVIFQTPGGDMVEIGDLSEGDYFGESALMKGKQKRAASIYADQAVSVLSLSEAGYAELKSKNPGIVNKLEFVKRRAAVLATDQENVHAIAISEDGERGVKISSKATKDLIFNIIRTNALFEHLEDEQIDDVIHNVYQVKSNKGDILMTQGEEGGHVYFVETGEFDVFVNVNQGNEQNVASFKGPCVTGELAMFHNAPRSATVKATTSAISWKIDRYTFRRVIRDLGASQIKLVVDFLAKVTLLAPLTNHERTKVAEACDVVEYPAGHVVFKEGDDGDAMYIVKSGAAVISKEGKQINRATVGDYFGERALELHEPRSATVTCAQATTLLKLDAAAFRLLLGPLDDILQKKATRYDQPDLVRAVETEKKVEWTDLMILGTLGRGSFGHVQLVRDSTTGKTYALKGVNKQQIVDTGQKEHILSEKNTLDSLRHTFIIRLFNTYKDRDMLYFLLEPVLGGELFVLLRQKMTLKEHEACFYAANVVSCFSYLHSKDIVYRDLKPENLLIDHDGYLKIADFGFAKKIDGKTWTLCGTPEYLAPEIVGNVGHSKGVDWWSVGVLIFEMLASFTPFYDADQLRMYSKILKERVSIPVHFSESAKDIVLALLQKQAKNRLGVIAGESAQVRGHRWFSGIDWKALYHKSFEAPWTPQIEGPEDMGNFDGYGSDDENLEPRTGYVDDDTKWDADF